MIILNIKWETIRKHFNAKEILEIGTATISQVVEPSWGWSIDDTKLSLDLRTKLENYLTNRAV